MAVRHINTGNELKFNNKSAIQVFDDRLDVLEGSTLHIDQSHEVFLYGLELGSTTVNQCIVVDEENQNIYATQAIGDGVQSFLVSKLTMGGKLIDTMTVTHGGHGTTIGLELVEGQVYIWSNLIRVDGSGNILTQFLCRFPYKSNEEINVDSVDNVRVLEFPDPYKYMTPLSDPKNDLLAIRHTDTSVNPKATRIEVYKMSESLNGLDNPLYTYHFSEEMNEGILQGVALDNYELYLSFGQNANDFHLMKIDLRSNQIVEEVKRPFGLNAENEHEEGFGEPEGLALYTDPETQQKTLLAVVVTSGVGRRFQKLFALTNNNGISRFIGLANQRNLSTKEVKVDLSLTDWSNYYTNGNQELTYYLNQYNQLVVMGIIKSDLAGANPLLFTLPSGLRPKFRQCYPLRTNDGLVECLVHENGEVKISKYILGVDPATTVFVNMIIPID
jgi:hypothetical protein